MIKFVDASEIKKDNIKVESNNESINKVEGGSINKVEGGSINKVETAESIKNTNKIKSPTIKLKQDIYYGPKNSNKNKFMRLYKKIGLTWLEGIKIEDKLVDGWFNKDKSQYIIKLIEEGGYKRFKFHGCDEIYDYFISLGAVPFELSDKDIATSSSTDEEEEHKFIGADLWAHHRTEQLLKKMPLNWGVKWK